MYDLFTPVLNKSVDQTNFLQAALEWSIVGHDVAPDETCVCGKKHISLLFTIQNRLNGNELSPIGSKCIHKFGRADLDQAAAERIAVRKARERAAAIEAERVREWGEQTLRSGPWQGKPFSTLCADPRCRQYIEFLAANASRDDFTDLVSYRNFISAEHN
jgi:hypothetical protein